MADIRCGQQAGGRGDEAVSIYTTHEKIGRAMLFGISHFASLMAICLTIRGADELLPLMFCVLAAVTTAIVLLPAR